MQKKLLKISIVGRTNASKSTLINNFIGEEISIINKKINTTEDLVLGISNINNNQLIFYDTPGLNNLKNTNKKNIKLKQNLWNGINQSDLIIYLIDVLKYDIEEIKTNIIKLKELEKEIIVVFNKNDLIKKKSILPLIHEINNTLKIESFFSISAKKKLGIDKLVKFLTTKSYLSEWIYQQNEISNMSEIYITNEITRNSILTLLHKEIPYNINIINQMFKNLKNGDLKIKQDIEIINSRYKKIILGKNGDKIKEIRKRSQNHISKILKSKVHLYLRVIKSNAEKI